MINEKDMLMRQLSSAQFALVELNLFLDTHPDSAEALKMFKAYKEKFSALLKEYEKRFGPITAAAAMDSSMWDWINGPWPWESNKEMNR